MLPLCMMKLGIYIVAPESISKAHLIDPSRQSVCLYVLSLLSLLGKGSIKCVPPFISRQRLGKHVPAATNTRSNRITDGRMCLSVYLPIVER
jgi:hypothetical protein